LKDELNLPCENDPGFGLIMVVYLILNSNKNNLIPAVKSVDVR